MHAHVYEHVYNSLKASIVSCGHATGGVQYHGVTDVASQLMVRSASKAR